MENTHEARKIDPEQFAVSVTRGGTAALDAVEAAENLNLLTYQQSKALFLNQEGKLPSSILNTDVLGPTVSLKGPVQLYTGTVTEFVITDYDSQRDYIVFASNCLIERIEDKLYIQTYSVPVLASFIINDRTYSFNVIYSPVNKPVIITPNNADIELDSVITFESNSFSMSGGYDVHASTDWQLALDVSFQNIVHKTEYDAINRTTWTVKELIQDTTYYLRTRHRSVHSGGSDWSNTIIFKTKVQYKPVIPLLVEPEINATNVNLETLITLSPFSIIGQANDGHLSTDWQLAADSNFSTIVLSSFDDSINKTTWHISGLNDLRTYYIRARYKGYNYDYGDWSPAYAFTTIVSNTVSTPNIITPVKNSTGNILNLNATASAFNVSGGFDTHQSTNWQIATDSGFINIIFEEPNTTVHKTTWAIPELLPNRNYYLRVRYKGSVLGFSNWSNVCTFKTIGVDRPSITSPANNSQNLRLAVTVQTGSFAATGTTDTHASTDWQLSNTATFANIIQSSIDDTNNKTSWALNLALNNVYYVRARHNGAFYGKGDWSEPIAFSTITKYSVLPPTITSPLNGANNQSSKVNFIADAFKVNDGSDIHTVSNWEVSTHPDFSTILLSAVDDPVNKTTWSVSGLSSNTVYYVRVRYKGQNNGYSDWSLVNNFKTVTSFQPLAPTIDYPQDGSTSVNLGTLILSSEFEVNGGTDTHAASDWQLSKDPNFTVLEQSLVNNEFFTVDWVPSLLSDLTKYYLRVRYRGVNYGYGPWSNTYTFTTVLANSVSTPSITFPVHNSDSNLTSLKLIATAFSVTGGSDSHLSTDWQIATDNGFSNIIQSVNEDTTNKTQYSISNLTSNTTYYARVRYRGKILPASAWSPAVSFRTLGIVTPSITKPTNGQGDIFPAVIFNSSTFTTNVGTDTHKSSDWQVATDAAFTNIVNSVTADINNKTIWSVALNINTTYYARVRYNGTSYGYSGWSQPVSFTTVKNYTVTKPSITSPTNATTGLRDTFAITSSAFAFSGGSDYHQSTDWQVATDTSFVNVVKSSMADTTNKTTWSVEGLSRSTIYYLRVKYNGANYGSSDWSTHIQVSTKATFEPSTEEAKFYAGDRGYSNHFGACVAISADGTRVAISDSVQNAVYVFKKSGTSWIQEAKLTVLASFEAGDLGQCLAINSDGSLIAAGAPETGWIAGAVFIFTRSGTSWSFSAKVESDDLASYDRFGSSVALSTSGFSMAVGATDSISSGSIGGVVYIFKRSGSTWTQDAVLVADDSAGGDKFGQTVSMSLSGTVVAIGAPLASRFNAGNSGVVYIFRKGIAWTQEAIILASDRTASQMFGYSLCISGDASRVIIGGQNSAYIYKNTSGAWTLEKRLERTPGSVGGRFGRSVTIDQTGSIAAVGDYLFTIPDVYVYLGAVYTFARTGTTWSNAAQVVPSFKANGIEFGWSISINSDGSKLAVGAYDEYVSTGGNIGMVGSGSGVRPAVSGMCYILT